MHNDGSEGARPFTVPSLSQVSATMPVSETVQINEKSYSMEDRRTGAEAGIDLFQLLATA